MEKIEILYTLNTEKYLVALIDILYNKEYFSQLEIAKKYVTAIMIGIESSIKIKQYKSTPIALIKHGSFYIAFKANKHTTWYAFFNIKENKYLIRHITNNHQKEASFLNK